MNEYYTFAEQIKKNLLKGKIQLLKGQWVKVGNFGSNRYTATNDDGTQYFLNFMTDTTYDTGKGRLRLTSKTRYSVIIDLSIKVGTQTVAESTILYRTFVGESKSDDFSTYVKKVSQAIEVNFGISLSEYYW